MCGVPKPRLLELLHPLDRIHTQFPGLVACMSPFMCSLCYQPPVPVTGGGGSDSIGTGPPPTLLPHLERSHGRSAAHRGPQSPVGGPPPDPCTHLPARTTGLDFLQGPPSADLIKKTHPPVHRPLSHRGCHQPLRCAPDPTSSPSSHPGFSSVSSSLPLCVLSPSPLRSPADYPHLRLINLHLRPPHLPAISLISTSISTPALHFIPCLIVVAPDLVPQLHSSFFYELVHV